MYRYDRDMMHERELIYDAKQQEKHGGSKKHDEELIYDAKGEFTTKMLQNIEKNMDITHQQIKYYNIHAKTDHNGKFKRTRSNEDIKTHGSPQIKK